MTPSTRFFRDTVTGLGATVFLAPVDCLDLQQVSYHHSWAGTAEGGCIYQMSNDPLVKTDPTNAKWIGFDPDPIYGNTTFGGGAGQQAVVIRQLLRWLRCSLVNTSGFSTVTTWTHGRNL